VQRTDNLLLATGLRCDGPGPCSGAGLRGYSLDGTPRFHLFGAQPIGKVRIVDGRAYVSGCNSHCHRVVDLRSGTVVADLRTKQQTMVVEI
jgi:hypothetical protein